MGRFAGFIAFMAIAMVLFVALGLWQVQRLAWKQEVIADRAAVLAAAPLPVERLAALQVTAADFHPATASGRYLQSADLLLHGQVLGGQLGVRVLTPLVMADGRAILVERGWLAQGTRTTDSIAVPPPPDGLVLVDGRYRVLRPATGLARQFRPDNQPDAGIWYHVDTTAMAAATRTTLLPGVLLADGGAPGVLARRVAVDPSLPNNHLGYALTWFGLALTTLVMTVISIIRRRRGGAA
ncbi:MAG: SURF1 family protein [Alphaproteobacteria bacterium]